jgi:hypothetical protein
MIGLVLETPARSRTLMGLMHAATCKGLELRRVRIHDVSHLLASDRLSGLVFLEPGAREEKLFRDLLPTGFPVVKVTTS